MPASLQDFVFDFGSLSPSEEGQYVKAMLREKLLKLRELGFELALLLALRLVITKQLATILPTTRER